MMVIERFYFSTGGHIKAIFLKKTLDKSIKIEGFALKMMTFFKEAFQVNRKSYPERVRSALFHAIALLPSIDKGRHGFDGQKYAHTASSPLEIRQVFPAGLSLPGHISAPAKLLRTRQRCIFEWFLVFETQAGWRPPRRKGQKAPERHAVRRVCPC